MKRAIIVVTALLIHLLSGSGIATESQITTYYWDGGWVEHASWPTDLEDDLNIRIDAWNWPDEFPPQGEDPTDYPGFWAELDNVIVDLVTFDDFEDEQIDLGTWDVAASGEGVSVEETQTGVLKVIIDEGPYVLDSVEYARVGGIVSDDYVLSGNFDVQVEFTVNPEYHTNHYATANLKLILTDNLGHRVEVSIRSTVYLSYDIPAVGGSEEKNRTSTDDLTGKLRITRTDIILPDDPVELIRDLVKDVLALELPDGLSNSLVKKLDTAIRVMEDYNEANDKAAVNSLRAFINAVKAQQGKKISEEDALTLIAQAEEIIGLIAEE
jgi:hypothetical protein